MRMFSKVGMVLILLWCAVAQSQETREWLPSWADSANRAALISFVENTTTPGRAEFIKPAERIAVFDNDGTLWAEQPLYFQLAYTLDRVRELAPQHPEWREQMPYKAVLENDLAAIFAGGEHALLELVLSTHAGNTTEEFASSVSAWLQSARHPDTGRPYTEMVYQPMLEILTYLRANGYKTYIVSGGGIEFMRVFAEQVYGVPPEQVIGSRVVTTYKLIDGEPAIVREAKLDFIDDKAGKPIAINQHIGRRPVIAFGNSDGDFQMLEWTTAGTGPRLGVYVHHDDAEREWAYDRDSSIGRLDKGLAESEGRGWLVVSMKSDWQRVFPHTAD
jgi:phosphoserine phosphatase